MLDRFLAWVMVFHKSRHSIGMGGVDNSPGNDDFDPAGEFNITLAVINGSTVPLWMVMGSFATADGDMDCISEVGAQFGNGFSWQGVISVTDSGGNLVKDFTLIDEHGVDWVTGSPIADITGDGQVNVDDLLAVINSWGDCPPGICAADVVDDGTVDVDDLLLVVNGWGA